MFRDFLILSDYDYFKQLTYGGLNTLDKASSINALINPVFLVLSSIYVLHVFLDSCLGDCDLVNNSWDLHFKPMREWRTMRVHLQVWLSKWLGWRKMQRYISIKEHYYMCNYLNYEYITIKSITPAISKPLIHYRRIR